MNSIKVYTMDRMMPLRKDYDFAFIGLLMSEDKPTGPGGSHSWRSCSASPANCSTRPCNTVSGPRKSSSTRRSSRWPSTCRWSLASPAILPRFRDDQKIKTEPKFKGVHCSLGISNSVRDLPGRRIGVCRAYVAKAMEYGLDAGIVNIAHHYGTVAPDPELLELVDAYAKMDGSMDKMSVAMDLMAKFCQGNRKPA